MSDDALTLILQHLDQHTLRFGNMDRRLDNIDREQTRLRTDLLGQMERVPTAMQLVKEDVTVAMAYAARADAGAERLEGKQGETG